MPDVFIIAAIYAKVIARNLRVRKWIAAWWIASP